MAIAYVADTDTPSLAGNGGEITGLSTGAGHDLIICARIYNADGGFTGVSSITDSAGNDWVFATSAQDSAPPLEWQNQDGAHIGALVAWSLGADPITDVTITLNDTYNGGDFNLSEWTGIGGYAAAGTISEASTAESVSPSLAVAAGDLYIGVYEGPGDIGLPAGATELTSAGGAPYFVYEIVPSGSSLQLDWGVESSNYVAAAQVFTPPSGTPHTRTAALTVTPSLQAARTRGRYRTGALTVTPVMRATGVTPGSGPGTLLGVFP
jgi:hypothetical protein